VSNLPELPESEGYVHYPAREYEPEWTSSSDAYTAEQMRAFAAEAVKQERDRQEADRKLINIALGLMDAPNGANLVSEVANLLRKLEEMQAKACDTCHDTGQICVGSSGQDSDGNAPVMERCPECGYGDEIDLDALLRDCAAFFGSNVKIAPTDANAKAAELWARLETAIRSRALQQGD